MSVHLVYSVAVVYLYMKICLKATMVYFGRNSSNNQNRLTASNGKMCALYCGAIEPLQNIHTKVSAERLIPQTF